MTEKSELTYWIGVSHLPRWTSERTNKFIIQILHEKKLNWNEFFQLDRNGWTDLYDLNEKEINDLENVKNEIPKLSFISERLINEGFDIIPINSSEYPKILKENLKIKNSPPIIYTKGYKKILSEDTVAIVGSRKAGNQALNFTNEIAKQCVENKKVIVSGFAKGVDKQALDSAISYNGKSIIVLPQGILTFQTGYKNYYESIVNGNVLVLSTFFPLAGWEVGLAMARNTYIYGLAQEIFVAESEESGGTWQGALDGLKRKRKVYVRVPEKDEKNANLKLIELGAIPVNLNLETKKLEYSIKSENKENEIHLEVNETVNDFGIKNSNFEENLVALLKLGEFTSKEISLKLKIDWNIKKLTDYLKKNPNIKVIKGKPYKFTIAEVFSPSMF
ncbi:MAG TPA: DNA transporter [Bacteroidetes bacterium]|nr:DNA transporter [Bacteroidota bacterium]